jgi:cobalt-precorrin 5A hydrolase
MVLEELWRGVAILYVINEDSANRVLNSLKRLHVPAFAFKYSPDKLDLAWRCFDAIVLMMPVSAAVRLLCPLIKDKTIDRPVVVVSEDLRYAIPILGAHWGANELALELSKVLQGVVPVITTASESYGITSVEELARKLITKIMNPELLSKVNAELLRGGCVEVHGLTALPTWVKGNYKLIGDCKYKIYVLDEEQKTDFVENVLILKKLKLSIGVGSKRGADTKLIKYAVLDVLDRLGVGIDRVDVIASVHENVKNVAEELGIKFMLMPLSDIGKFRPNDDCLTPPSESLTRLGIIGVAEPLALIAGGPTARLIMRKVVYDGEVTVAVAAHE